jgi:hypothetical protein
MPVIRTENQGSGTLEEFYDSLVSQNQGWKNTRDSMLKLIDCFNKEFPNQMFYALTSHSRLVILENEETFSDWLVIFSSSFPDEYYIDAMLPDNKSIWKDSRITANVKGTEKALEYFKIALKNLERT